MGCNKVFLLASTALREQTGEIGLIEAALATATPQPSAGSRRTHRAAMSSRSLMPYAPRVPT